MGRRSSGDRLYLEQVTTDAGLTLVPTATFEILARPAVVVPGERKAFAIREPATLAWLRAAHPHTRFTTSVIQLGIEYDPQPPFRSGSPRRAGWLTRAIAHLAMRRYDAAARPDK